MGNLANQTDFGWPNAEIGQKMANGRRLFLALGNARVFVLHVQIMLHFQLFKIW